MQAAADQGERYDDSVLNLLRLESDRTPAARIALYRNLIDLMMQNRPSTCGARRARIFETLGRIHKDVPQPVRRHVADIVSRQRVAQPLDLVSWLWAADAETVVQMMPTLTLRESDWLEVLPRLPQMALAQLAQRQDMTDAVRRALASLGAAGLGLPTASSAELTTTVNGTALSPDAPTDAVAHAAAKDSAAKDAAKDSGAKAQGLHLLPVAEEHDTVETPERTQEPAPDWSHVTPKFAEQESRQNSERLEFVARAVLGGEKIAVAASNDDQPLELAADVSEQTHAADAPPIELTQAQIIAEDTSAVSQKETAPTPAPLSDEAQQQIRDLIRRIAAFRKRWIDKQPATVSQTHASEALAAAADAIQADVEAARQDLSQIEPETEAPLILTPSIAANIGPAKTALPPDASLEAAALHDIAASLADFQWESDRAGRFVQAQSAQLTVGHGAGLVPAMAGRALVGLFSDPVVRLMVDHAVRRRTAFRNARFEIDTGLMKGQWRLSGVPVFDSASGLYQGHRGVAERLGAATLVLHGDAPATLEAVSSASVPASDRLATLAHETRTPLNAIMGFAQLIDGQTWGEVPEQYRERAAAILEQSNRLLRALDDVSDQAKLDRGAYTAEVSHFDAADVLIRVRDNFMADAERREVTLLARLSDGLPKLWSDRDMLERALARLLAIALAGAKPQELILLSARAMPDDMVCFSIAQPAHASEPDTTSSDSFADGFGVKLVRQLAGALSGRLEIGNRRYALIIPALAAVPEQKRERS